MNKNKFKNIKKYLKPNLIIKYKNYIFLIEKNIYKKNSIYIYLLNFLSKFHIFMKNNFILYNKIN